VWPSPDRGRIQPRPDVAGAPKWSWPSVHGQVIWDNWSKSALSSVRIVDIHYICVGSSHMGDVSEAKITMRAPLIVAGKLLGDHLKTRPRYYERLRADAQITEAIPPEDDAPGPLDEIAVYDFDSNYRIDAASGPSSPTDSEVFIIPMGCAVDGSHAGLCMRRSRDHSTYERFGLAQLRHRIAMRQTWTRDGNHWDRKEEAGVLSTAILEALPLSSIILV
jgi:hypothetical protein